MSQKLKSLVALAGVAAFSATALLAVKATPMLGSSPFFLDPFGGATVNIVTQPGVAVSQQIWASDFGLASGDFLTLKWNNLPAGSITTPPCPIVGAPGADVKTIWSWTPTLADVGLHTATFTVVDSNGMSVKADLKITVEPPFAVEIGSIEVTQSDVGAPASIRWTTLSEIDNAYFNVYRSSGYVFEEASRLNGYPHMAVGSPFEGAEYEHVDLRVNAGSSYRYWIEAVDIYGEAEVFGPFSLYAR